MASGKLSPRQRMINLMYLVFIAMIALTTSTEVLTAFGNINKKMEDANTVALSNSERVLEALAQKAAEQPEKYQDEYEKAQTINGASDEFYSYLEGLKTQFLADVEDKEDYEVMDRSDVTDAYFFQSGSTSKDGKAFLEKIDNYRNAIISTLDAESQQSIIEDVNARFDIGDVRTSDGTKQPWLNNRFEGFPLVASITNLTSIQNDIIETEREVYNSMLSGQLQIDAGVSENTYGTIFMPDKPVFLQGEAVTGKIVLGRYDSSLKPERVIVNGKQMTQMNQGAAIVSLPAGKLGENNLNGEFVFIQNQEEVSIPVQGSFTVISKPSDAVVAADKMNVVYRGIDNPITISIPGVNNKDVVARASGLKKVKGSSYILRPGQGNTITINVSGKLSDGSPINSKAVFRIKDIPAPMASVRKEVGVIQMPKSSLNKATIGAELVDFVFDLNLKTTSFKFKVPGQATVEVRGNKLDSRAQRALSKAKRGDIITIFDVKAQIVGNSSYRLKNVMPVSIEISN